MALRLRIRELRLALGMTQVELAERAGVRRATVNRIENTRVQSIDFDVLERIADALQTDPGLLLIRVDDAAPPPAGTLKRGRPPIVSRSKRT